MAGLMGSACTEKTMNRGSLEKVPLSRLKGIAVYVQDDLYNLARIKLELNDARAKYEGSTAIARPTINGLAKLFAGFIDACTPDYDYVFAVIQRHKLPLTATIDFDESCQQTP